MNVRPWALTYFEILVRIYGKHENKVSSHLHSSTKETINSNILD